MKTLKAFIQALYAGYAPLRRVDRFLSRKPHTPKNGRFCAYPEYPDYIE